MGTVAEVGSGPGSVLYHYDKNQVLSDILLLLQILSSQDGAAGVAVFVTGPSV